VLEQGGGEGAIAAITVERDVVGLRRQSRCPVRFEWMLAPGPRLQSGSLGRTWKCENAALGALLLEHRRASRAQVRLLPPQAHGNRPGVRDLAGAEPVDVGGAGPALFRGTLGGG